MGKLLTQKVKKERNRNLIIGIKTKDGEISNDIIKIKKTFTEYYKEFYKAGSVERDKINFFLQKTNIPKLSLDDKEFMEKDITIQEIETAIQNLKINKAPGPDGYTA